MAQEMCIRDRIYTATLNHIINKHNKSTHMRTCTSINPSIISYSSYFGKRTLCSLPNFNENFNNTHVRYGIRSGKAESLSATSQNAQKFRVINTSVENV